MIILTPYRQDKDLGRAYNEAMRMIPENGHACFMDIDAMFLTPQQPAIIENYIEKYPDAVLTCYTNRISPLSKQLLHGRINDNPDIITHLDCAAKMQLGEMKVQRVTNTISGFLMVVPKSVWKVVKFVEGTGCLGVDTLFSKACHIHGVKILLMENVYVFHTYRIKNGVKDKTHLV